MQSTAKVTGTAAGPTLARSGHTLLTWSVAAVVGVIPLLLDLGSLSDTYYAPKARALHIFALILVAGLLVRLTDPRLRKSRLWLPLVTFAFTAVLATLLSMWPGYSLTGAPRRHEGLLTLLAYAAVAGATMVACAGGGRRIWTAAVLTGGTVAAVYGIAQSFGYDWLVRDSVRLDWWRPFATAGNPNFLGAYMVLTAPLAAGVVLTADRPHEVALAAVALGCAVLTALLTYSRAAWVGLLVAVLVFGRAAMLRTGFIRTDPRARRRGVVTLVLLLTAAGLFFAPGGPLALSRAEFTPAARATPSVDPGDPYAGIPQRLYLWRGTLALLARRPSVGYGPETLRLVFPQAWDAEKQRLFGEMPLVIDKAHNDTLDMAMSIGLLGVAAYWWLLVSVLRSARRAVRTGGPQQALASAYVAAIAGYVVALQFHFSVVSVAPIFWSILGAAVAAGEFNGR